MRSLAERLVPDALQAIVLHSCHSLVAIRVAAARAPSPTVPAWPASSS
jgi:hypothetical protein